MSDVARPLNVRVVPVGQAEFLPRVQAVATMGLPNLKVAPPHGRRIALVASGPSLNAHLDEVLAFDGDIMSMNATHGLLLQHGRVPTYHASIDTRERVADYVKGAVPGCTYLIAGSSHPSIWEHVRGCDTAVWYHKGDPASFQWLLENVENFTALESGCTVGVNAMTLAYMLGYREIHLFGYDGSWSDAGRSHFNDDPYAKHRIRTLVAGREFVLDKWMVGQADDFQVVLSLLTREGCTITPHGDGLLPWLWHWHQQMSADAVGVDLLRIPVIELPEVAADAA